MEDRPFEVYKWILYRVNGMSKDEINEIGIDDDWSEVEAIAISASILSQMNNIFRPPKGRM